MGLYDELRVEIPLPDGFDPQGRLFQTKDTPNQGLSRYVLTAEGTLRDDASGAVVSFHGALTFYDTNVCASAEWGMAMDDDRAPWWAEYCALFDHGRLLKLEGSKRSKDCKAHIPRAMWHAQLRRWQEEGDAESQ